MDKADDLALLRAVREGDARAMARIVAVHGPAVYALLRRMLRGDAAVDDLFQDVFLTFARRAPELDPATNLHAWLLVVAANRWRSYRRWRLVDPTRWLVLDAHEEPHATPDEALDAEETLAQRQAFEHLERALASLPKPPPLAVPEALTARAVRSATRAMPRALVKRVPDLVLALYCLGELLHALRVVHVIP